MPKALAECTVGIAGLGLMGGSYARALRLNVRKIIGWTRNQQVAQHAVEEQYVEAAVTPEQLAAEADLLLVALPPAACADFICRHRRLCKPGTVITDVAGVKSGALSGMMGCDPRGVDFIGGHPLCGREGNGLSRARGEVFLGGDYVLTPVQANLPENLTLVENMALSIGCRRVMRMDPGRHDIIVAATSQLPHVFACLLTQNAAATGPDVFTGGSYRDASRVAEINPELWTELCLANGQALTAVLERAEAELQKCRQALVNRDAKTLNMFFTRGARAWQEVDQNVTQI